MSLKLLLLKASTRMRKVTWQTNNSHNPVKEVHLYVWWYLSCTWCVALFIPTSISHMRWLIPKAFWHLDFVSGLSFLLCPFCDCIFAVCFAHFIYFNFEFKFFMTWILFETEMKKSVSLSIRKEFINHSEFLLFLAHRVCDKYAFNQRHHIRITLPPRSFIIHRIFSSLVITDFFWRNKKKS